LGDCVLDPALLDVLFGFVEFGRRCGFRPDGELGCGGVFGDFADHLAVVDAEAGAAGILYGDPEGFEDQVGAAQVDVVAGQGVDDFHERGLDGFFVLDHGDGMKAGVGRSAYSAQHALVEVAELLSAHGGRAALDAGDFDVLAVANILVERHLI
jgi:hypothetical protein